MITNENINIAVEWWANKIKTFYPHSNGSNEEASKLSCLFADQIALKHMPSMNKIEKFKSCLYEYIIKEAKKVNKIYLSCDYGPGSLLSEAADDADINYNVFPYKVNMIITEKEVRVSDGYSEPYVTLH